MHSDQYYIQGDLDSATKRYGVTLSDLILTTIVTTGKRGQLTDSSLKREIDRDGSTCRRINVKTLVHYTQYDSTDVKNFKSNLSCIYLFV